GQQSRMRVAYVSGDFREHAVSYLMAGVLEQHDRSLFEIIAVSPAVPPLVSPMRERIIRACDQFHDVSRMTDRNAAAQLRDLEVDIAVDLSGHTDGGRAGIFTHRPAPIQVSYLGHPGTLAAPYMDYLLADEFVIPPEQRAHYSEQVVYLPECFQAN